MMLLIRQHYIEGEMTVAVISETHKSTKVLEGILWPHVVDVQDRLCVKEIFLYSN